MTARPSACVIFNNLDESSSIGSLSLRSVRAALEAGWRISVIARDLDESVRGEVEWIPMYVPPRLHAVQWYSALPVVCHLTSGRRWDVVHVQQPQLTRLANLLHLHYLVQAAREHAVGPSSAGLRAAVGRAQTRLTEWGEARILGHVPAHLRVMPVSDFLAEELVRLYAVPESAIRVLPSPGPNAVRFSAHERAIARQNLVGARSGLVIGFLGGDDPRKGGRALLDAASGRDDVVVLWGGGGIPDHPLASDSARVVPVGYVHDRRRFFAACDAFAAVSTFDPGPLTVWEATAHGVPVIGTLGCGIVRDLAKVAGVQVWQPGTPVPADAVRRDGGRMVRAARLLLEQRSSRAFADLLIEQYGEVSASPRSVIGGGR